LICKPPQSTEDKPPANNKSTIYFSIDRTEYVVTFSTNVPSGYFFRIFSSGQAKPISKQIQPPKEDMIHVPHQELPPCLANSSLTCLFFFLCSIQIHPFVQGHSLDLQHPQSLQLHNELMSSKTSAKKLALASHANRKKTLKQRSKNAS
jgi:hypothetical protein